MIIAKNISVSFGASQILRDVSFSAEPGSMNIIIGPNGSGKTTLLKALCNDLPYRGEITLNGKNLSTLSSSQTASMRAILPQASVLSFPFMVREVVALGLTGGRPGVSQSELVHLPERALEAVDLSGFSGRFYQDLSGGEQQRVHLARVLCQVWCPVLDGIPRFLFLDEPVSSLDIKHQLLILQIARQFALDGGGVVAILHDLNLTAMFADKVTAIRKGVVVGSGTPREVLQDGLIENTFDCALRVGAIPSSQTPFVLPQSFVSQD